MYVSSLISDAHVNLGSKEQFSTTVDTKTNRIMKF